MRQTHNLKIRVRIRPRHHSTPRDQLRRQPSTTIFAPIWLRQAIAMDTSDAAKGELPAALKTGHLRLAGQSQKAHDLREGGRKPLITTICYGTVTGD